VKRAFLVVAALAATVLSFAPADATTKKQAVDVNWIQNRAANPHGGLADSTTTRALGAATPTAHDTSAAIGLMDFVLPEKGAGQLPTASDSIAWLRIDFYPSSATPTAGADTVNLTIQVSADGVANWVSCTPTSIFDTTTDSALGAIILEQATNNTFRYTLRQRVGAVAAGDVIFPLRSSSTAPTFQELFSWPYMRLVIQSDRTGRYDARVTGFLPACD
jgi:hypothetical protein